MAVKCRDGIIIQSDTLFSNEDDYSIIEGKLFCILDTKNQNIALLLANRRDWFEETIELLRKKFSITGENLTQETIRELLAESRLKQMKDFFDEIKAQGKDPENEIKERRISYPFFGIVVVRLTKNENIEYHIYNYDLIERPHSELFLTIGDGNIEVSLLLGKVVNSFLNRMELKWEDLSAKLVSQILYFVMRYTTQNRITVGGKINGYLLNKNGLVSYGLEEFFNKTYEDVKKGKEKDYLPEFVQTIIDELPPQKTKEFAKIAFSKSKLQIVKSILGF